jgi:hypothetical protein
VEKGGIFELRAHVLVFIILRCGYIVDLNAHSLNECKV